MALMMLVGMMFCFIMGGRVILEVIELQKELKEFKKGK